MDSQPPPLPTDPPARPPVSAARGWFLIVLGVLLSGGMAAIANFLYQTVLHNDDPGTHARWEGGPGITRTAFELFGAVFVYGLASVAAGVYVLCTRRISRVIGAIMVALVVVILYFGARIVLARLPH